MKRIIFTAIILLFTSVLFAQEKDSTNKFVFPKHEVRLSYGINSLPNGIRMDEKDIWKGGFTATYMYRVVKWFWVGGNFNWQFPSDTKYYTWREYYADGSFSDFKISGTHKFFAIAPEFRFSFLNKKWVTLYGSFSIGYGMYTKALPNDILNDYWFWNVTCIGVNIHIGKKQNFFAGCELGAGFKGTMMVHAGYRF